MKRKASGPFATEESLAAAVIPWLADQDFEVFQEVQSSRAGKRADLVGRRGSTIIVVECKLQFGERIVSQGRRWLRECNIVYVAVPTLSVHGHGVLSYACRSLGIGVIEVSPRLSNHAVCDYIEIIAPAIRRTRGSDLVSALREEHKTECMAGTNGGGYWTPFRATCRAIAEFVTQNPGVTLRDTIAGIKHHYASEVGARGAIRKWIELGRIPGVRLEVESGKARLYSEGKR